MEAMNPPSDLRSFVLFKTIGPLYSREFPRNLGGDAAGGKVSGQLFAHGCFLLQFAENKKSAFTTDFLSVMIVPDEYSSVNE